ncbi:hypothetical protein OKW21_004552 [Catalinimonas alkaloidigena]|uniref:heparinase II/III family protein n=1 Tax=Catalinimonas alkaloidigena TaxID=1075417 RepID=UPI002405164F|nr:heparinase II/III family protein [Catalinimonas alkaloidigena]MDF9799289.1 hypothetical protein [Catalinimonas alkaloidigena]
MKIKHELKFYDLKSKLRKLWRLSQDSDSQLFAPRSLDGKNALRVAIPVIFFTFSLFSVESMAQSIPANSVIPIENLADYLSEDARDELKETDSKSLAEYFREKFSERFFYDYQTFYDRLSHYNRVFNNQEDHKERALDHLGKYADSTQWVLPFNYLTGDPVDAYAIRHLARQHKMVDIALYYFNGKKDPELIKYFENQLRSLNAALHAEKYETIEDGNGIYEVFRSGYRILNWLWIHNMFLNEAEYSDEDQLLTIATLLQHGQHLYERNDQFHSGNHQTRGMSALAMLAILFRDFEGTALWLERAMLRLSEHLDKEINDDGFQFERSVHYHMSDINNYFYVYQLAKLNGIEIDKAWKEKLRGLFTTLVKVAYPDRSAPVLQDDTEIPWAEQNDISGAMTLGYLLFEDPEFGYFATNKVDDRVYWFLSNEQVKMLENIERKRPSYGSLAFTDTHYYIMREGWEADDKMMVISAGLDAEKPDHQHGDMLGIQAMAHGHAILPNYQVRYSLQDFDFFKNSMVKNVALVDDEVQGKKWTSNQGGSGFGKFGELPKPEVLAWEVNDDFDLFAGRHDGFENVGVKYTRQVIYVKNEFWIVKDDFKSAEGHDYKQVWQGHYTDENGPDLLRASAADACGHDILQLNKTDSVFSSGTRGKQWSVVSKFKQKNFNFITAIFPYRGYDKRLDEDAKEMTINDWEVNQSEWEIGGGNSVSLASDSGTFLFNVKALKRQNLTIQSSEETDLFIKTQDKQLFIRLIGTQKQTITVIPERKSMRVSRDLEPGQLWVVDL